MLISGSHHCLEQGESLGLEEVFCFEIKHKCAEDTCDFTSFFVTQRTLLCFVTQRTLLPSSQKP